MKLVTRRSPLSIEDLRQLASARFGSLVKGVVDLDRGVMLVGAELHADEEAELLATGSRQQDLWGINLYPELPDDEWIEFDSMINLRPSQGNHSRSVDDPAIRERIGALVRQLARR